LRKNILNKTVIEISVADFDEVSHFLSIYRVLVKL